MSYRKIFATFFLLSAVLGLPAEKIHVAFCCDQNRFCEHIGVAAYSIGKNMASGDELVIHILMLETMEDSHRTKFQQLQHEFAGRMEIHVCDNTETTARIRNLIEGIDPRPNTIGYYIPLTFDKILLNDIPKVICLDSDIVVQTSLRNFWNILPKSPYYIAGVRDYYNNDPKNLDTHAQNHYVASLQDFTDNPETLFSLYINTGVMLLNLERIRKHDFFSKAITEARNDPRKISHLYFQTLINIVFRGRILECRGKWNTLCFPQVNNPSIAIMHFAGRVRRPWLLAEKLNDPNSPVFIAETQGSSSQPVIHTLSRAIPRASVSLQQEQRIIFKEKLLAMPKGASIPREAWNVVQQIPEISDMIQRLGCLQEDLSTLNYDLDIAIVGLDLQASDDSPLTIPLKISVPTSPIAICALHAPLDPQMDSAPAQGEEIRIKSAPSPWILCERDSSYQVIPQKNLWALLTFEGARRRLSVTLYLHPTSSATSAQLESIRSAGNRDWDTVHSAFTSETDPAQAGTIADIMQLLPRKEELGLVQNNSDEDTVDLQFSSLWHWYREMSPWRHYY